MASKEYQWHEEHEMAMQELEELQHRLECRPATSSRVAPSEPIPVAWSDISADVPRSSAPVVHLADRPLTVAIPEYPRLADTDGPRLDEVKEQAEFKMGLLIKS